MTRIKKHFVRVALLKENFLTQALECPQNVRNSLIALTRKSARWATTGRFFVVQYVKINIPLRFVQ